MKQLKRLVPYLATMAGLILLASGLITLKLIENPEGMLRALPFVCIGIGCGVFGSGIGRIVSNRVMKNHPELERQQEINQKDERNSMIANKAKSKAFDIMIYVFSALMLSFALMGVDLAAVLLLVAAYLLVIGCSIYFRIKYEKEF